MSLWNRKSDVVNVRLENPEPSHWRSWQTFIEHYGGWEETYDAYLTRRMDDSDRLRFGECYLTVNSLTTYALIKVLREKFPSLDSCK